ncbi:MAG TPA: hypothetical protein VFY23_17365 [Candidatus Limnocylindrales bacterium]|nr:hypothetical protein [Candidatus Limnocylindrales bacterium]
MNMTGPLGGSTSRDADAELRRPVRRLLVLVAMLGYPLLVVAWLGLPAAGITGLPWAIAVGAIGLAVLMASFTLYQFRRSMAQSPDAMLDERQVRVRDRAYLVAYQAFAGMTLIVLLLLGIGADALDAPVTLTYDVIQPLIWGAILYGMVLPSAVVAWQEPDLDGEE